MPTVVTHPKGRHGNSSKTVTKTFYVGGGASDAMTKQKFWSVIAATKPEEGFDAQAQRLNDLLSALPTAAVEGFEQMFHDYRNQAEDHADLREMAQELGGGAGDDGWSDFCSWVVSRGREVYRAALQNPSTLRSVAAESEAVDFEEFQYVAGRIINKASGGDEL